MGAARFLQLAGLAACIASSACGGETGLEMIHYPLSARGEGGGPFEVAGWQVTIDEATIGFGPLYLCASVAASTERCRPAVAEFAATATVNAASASPQVLGEVEGFSGTVHSALYDFAHSWPGEGSPKAFPEAPGGHSVRMRVTARKADRVLGVRAELDLVPHQRGKRTVEARLPETVQSGALELELVFDAGAWWSRVDFDALATLGGSEVIVPATSPRPAAGAPAHDPVRVVFEARNTLVIAITSTKKPRFVFRQP